MSNGVENQIHPFDFFSVLNWLDGRPLMEVIEPYRARIFKQALYEFTEHGRPRYNLALDRTCKEELEKR